MYPQKFLSPLLLPTNKSIITIPSSPCSCPSLISFSDTNLSSPLAPKISPVNETVWEWWLFSTISTTTLESLTIGFYTATSTALPFDQPDPGGVLFTTLTGTFANGTVFGYEDFSPVRAVVKEDGTMGLWDSGDTGDWDEYKIWVGSEDYEVFWGKWDWHVRGVKGSFFLDKGKERRSRASREVMPLVGWNNVVPLAEVLVDFLVGGSRMRYEGIGYLEKMWGARPFGEVGVDTVSWGFGRLGMYEVVWFSGVSPIDGKSYSSSYLYDIVSKSIVSASNSPGAVIIRPWQETSRGPSPSSVRPRGCAITFPNAREGMDFELNVTLQVLEDSASFGARWPASVEGGWVEEWPTLYHGVAMVDGPECNGRDITT